MEERGECLWVILGGERMMANISVGYWNQIAERCRSAGYLKIFMKKEFPESVGPLIWSRWPNILAAYYRAIR